MRTLGARARIFIPFRLISAGALVLVVLITFAGARFGFSAVVAILLTVCLAALIIRWPIVGFFVVTACVVLVEQEPLAFPIFTDGLDVFHWPPSLAGMPERPIGVILLGTLLVLVCRRLALRERPLRGGALMAPLGLLMLCVLEGVVHGLTSGGDSRIIVLEVRPFEYLFLAYLLAYNLVTTRRQLQAFFWIVIIGAGVKALQGVYIVFGPLHGHLSGQNEIMAHEESFFFVALLLLIALFCLHYRYRAQLLTALAIVPPLVIALVANNRRADYVALLLGLAVAWILVVVVNPRTRARHLKVMAVCAVLGGAYIVIFANGTGAIAAPAHSIVATIHPSASDARDAASNAYRVDENYDLKVTAKQNPWLGWGFGKPFLQPITLPDIITLDPYYLYIPHDTVYWILMRLGIFGYLAFWSLIAAAIIRGCLIVRRLRDRYLQLIGIYAVAVVPMTVLLGYADYQLSFYRNVIYLGLLLGILMRLPALDELPAETPAGTRAAGVAPLSKGQSQ